MTTDRATYVAHVHPDGMIQVWADDMEYPAATIELPPGKSLRGALDAAGWRPTGRRTPSGGWGSIHVERMQRLSRLVP
jgi:hypothetical protein